VISDIITGAGDKRRKCKHIKLKHVKQYRKTIPIKEIGTNIEKPCSLRKTV